MSIICWNYRGAGNTATVRELRELATKFAPSILCIVETQINKALTENLAATLGYDNGYAVGSIGTSGGIGMFWNNGIKVEILGYSEYHVDATISDMGDIAWHFTCMCGKA